jgi:hypothetical protein
MMLGRVLPLSAAKEIRALLPLWLGCVAALLCLAAAAATGAVGDGGRQAWGTLIYCGTSVALGALSIGQEYTHRTLPLLLAQPTSRARVFLVKQSVLAALLIVLAGIAWGTVLFPSSIAAMLVLLSVAGGLFVAPWLTMLSRNPLAGTVFTIAIPGVLLGLFNELVTGRIAFVAASRALLAISLAAAVMGWRTFMRLEAFEGRGHDLRLPMTPADLAPARTGHPLWRLVKKELGLQQLSIAVAGIASLGWLAIFLVGLVTSSRRESEDLIGAMTFLYSGLLAMVIGSLGSAEERQLGTLQWQVLLPIASWKQWMVKAGTALGLALLLAAALPALVFSLSGGPIRIDERFAYAILLLTTVSLYVSSLSTSGVKALFLSVPLSMFVLSSVIAQLTRVGTTQLTLLPMGLFAIVLAIVLYFASLNHRSAERGAWWVGQQIFCIAGSLALGGAVLTLVNTFHGRGLR